jgi:hypothetical protein
MRSYSEALKLQREIGIQKESGDTLIDMGVLLADRGQMIRLSSLTKKRCRSSATQPTRSMKLSA